MEIEQLVKACQKGDRQAFEELIRLFFPYVSGFLLKLTPDVSLAEDLTQETFLKMIRGIDREPALAPGWSPSPGTFILTLCGAVSRRRSWRHCLCAIPQTWRQPWIKGCSMKRYFRPWRSSPEQGLAIRLKYVENQTLAEIAERFGVPPNIVKSRIHEGVVKLRRRFHSTERTEQDETKR